VTLLFYLQTRYELFCCVCFYQSALGRLCVIVLYALSSCFSQGNVRYPECTCRDPISLILQIRFPTLGIQIGSLNALTKPWTWCLLQNLKIKQIHQEIHFLLQLVESKAGVSQRKLL